MIMRYICKYFAVVALDEKIGLLKYDQYILLLKNKYLNAPNEDIVLESLEYWISSQKNFQMEALDFDQTNLSNDSGSSFKRLQELINNINWPILSLNIIMKILSKPNGVLKKYNIIR